MSTVPPENLPPYTTPDQPEPAADDVSVAKTKLEPVGIQRQIPLAPHQLKNSVTSQKDLFTIAHYGIARVDLPSWTLTIGGLVKRPLTLSLTDLQRLPKKTVESFHQCAGFPRRHDIATRRIANVVWGGADLADILETTGIEPSARFLWSFGLDEGQYTKVRGGPFQKDMPLSRLAQGDVILAYEINGEALTAQHGFPLRLVIPGYYGTNSVKWLYKLELAERRSESVFTTVFYNDPVSDPADPLKITKQPLWEAPPEAVIVSPQSGAILRNSPVDIWGWAWAARGISTVDISTDGGATWIAGEVGPRAQWSWQRFLLRWTPRDKGTIEIVARATDTEGKIQPESKARNAMHRVTVVVTA